MALKYRKVQTKVLVGDNAGQIRTHAIAKAGGYCDLKKLCKLISARCAMSSADVKAILDSLNWAMDLELQAGNIVQVGEFGNFRLSIRSESTATEEEFDATKIKGVHIVFTPGESLRLTKSEMDYEHDKPQECEKQHVV